MKQGKFTALLLCVLTVQAQGAFKKEEEAFARRQGELDRQCEAARAEKLAPLRERLFKTDERQARYLKPMGWGAASWS